MAGTRDQILFLINLLGQVLAKVLMKAFLRNTLNWLRMTFILPENQMLDTIFQLSHPGFTKETKTKKELL
ncbi:unnamed protein product [Lathyrus oleraceus]